MNSETMGLGGSGAAFTGPLGGHVFGVTSMTPRATPSVPPILLSFLVHAFIPPWASSRSRDPAVS